MGEPQTFSKSFQRAQQLASLQSYRGGPSKAMGTLGKAVGTGIRVTNKAKRIIGKMHSFKDVIKELNLPEIDLMSSVIEIDTDIQKFGSLSTQGILTGKNDRLSWGSGDSPSTKKEWTVSAEESRFKFAPAISRAALREARGDGSLEEIVLFFVLVCAEHSSILLLHNHRWYSIGLGFGKGQIIY